MILQRVHDRQFGGAGIAEQMRAALIFEKRKERRAAGDAVHESPPPFPRPLPSVSGHHDRSETGRSRKRDHGCPASLDSTPRASSEQPVMIDTLLPFRALPDYAGKPLQRHQPLAGVGPLLQLLQRDMIDQLEVGTSRDN